MTALQPRAYKVAFKHRILKIRIFESPGIVGTLHDWIRTNPRLFYCWKFSIEQIEFRKYYYFHLFYVFSSLFVSWIDFMVIVQVQNFTYVEYNFCKWFKIYVRGIKFEWKYRTYYTYNVFIVRCMEIMRGEDGGWRGMRERERERGVEASRGERCATNNDF